MNRPKNLTPDIVIGNGFRPGNVKRKYYKKQD